MQVGVAAATRTPVFKVQLLWLAKESGNKKRLTIRLQC